MTAYSMTLQILYLTACFSDINSGRITEIPGNVRGLREYVDQHFQSVQTVSDIAGHFYYSREYVSKLFKQYYWSTNEFVNQDTA